VSKQRATLSLLLPSVFALLCAGWLIFIPSDAKNSILFGFSAARLGLLVLLLLLASGFARAAWLAFYSASARVHILLDRLEQNSGISLLLFSALLLASAYFLLIPQEYLKQYQALHQRLLPLAIWLFLTTLTFTASLAFARLSQNWRENQPFLRSLLPGFAVALAFFLAIWLLIALTGMGIGAPQDFWSRPAVPILWPQTFAALLVGVMLTNLLPRAFQRRLEVALLALLAILAVFAWSSQVDLPGTFNTPPTPPTYEIFPINDSEIYDSAAQRLRAGHGLDSLVIDKPLYIAHLAMLHSLDAGSYQRFYLLQIAFFTLIPLCGYFLGRELHSRHLGLAFALLLIIKEQNAIALTNYLSMSTTKMILSEPLTALGVLAFTLYFVKWLKDPRLANPALWISGGFLGLTSLARLNSVTILPLAILLIGLALRFRWKKWFTASLVFTAFVILAVTPWMIRCAIQTGSPVSFIMPKTRGVIATTRYEPILEAAVQQIPEQPAPTAFEKYSGLGQKIVIHYIHNLVSVGIMLPPTPIQYTLFDIIRRPYWKMEWHGDLTLPETLTLFASLSISALGIAAAAKRWRAAGLAPLAVALGYNLSAAIALTSGGRYLIPFEWVLIFYYFLGWMDIFHALGFLHPAPGALPAPTAPNAAQSASPITNRFLPVRIAALFLLLGALPALIESLVPPRYSLPSNPQNIPWEAATPPAALGALTGQSSTRILHGMALYPRFYPAGDGLVDVAQLPLLTRQPYDRLTFYLAGPVSDNIILPIESLPPDYPPVADAWVVGCQRAGYIEALAVILQTKNGPQQLLSTQTTCP
jgi:hypothetical protein